MDRLCPPALVMDGWLDDDASCVGVCEIETHKRVQRINYSVQVTEEEKNKKEIIV